MKIVMRGLDPRIHSSVHANGEMDRRVKPGDDNLLVRLQAEEQREVRYVWLSFTHK
jgi:hypothetical protein